ncbi:hypothetical protein Q2T40_19260 [Winogradskyella maritima]|uniref:Lipoprotein n=1 Tax=Winogradskyella maritima TaxID=1517766 RepID=A0ABV8AEF5_9FLAO|nr:hypothetical protein [Winogradskyella maritima]
MKRLINFLTLILFFSCNNEKNITIEEEGLSILYTKEFKEVMTNPRFIKIQLDSIKNFSTLIDRMGELSCDRKISGLSFVYDKTEYNLIGSVPCPISADILCYFRVNHIFIKNDSLYTSRGKTKVKQPIEYLGKYIDDLIQKTYTHHYKEDKMKTAIINLNIEDQYPISTTKKVLSEIYNEFNRIALEKGEDYFKYHILFEKFVFLNIPPPPPPPSK